MHYLWKGKYACTSHRAEINHTKPKGNAVSNDNADKYRSQLYDSPAIIITDYDHSQGKCCHQPVLPGAIGFTALPSCHIANGNGV